MSKLLQSLRKIAGGSKIAHLVAHAPDAMAAAVFGLACPCSIEGTPPFAARPAARDFDPRGGHRAPVSLPLTATPYGISEGEGVKK